MIKMDIQIFQGVTKVLPFARAAAAQAQLDFCVYNINGRIGDSLNSGAAEASIVLPYDIVIDLYVQKGII